MISSNTTVFFVYFVMQTIFVGVSAMSGIWCEEILWPVLYVRRSETDQDTVDAANDSIFGRVVAVVTRGAACGNHVADVLNAGAVRIKTP